MSMRSQWLKGFVFILGISLLSFPGIGAAAEEEKSAEAEFVEPIIIEETMPNEVGEWDLRLSAQLSRKSTKELSTVTAPRAQLFFGITERLGGEVNLPYLFRTEKSEIAGGIGDASVGLKWLLAVNKELGKALVLGLELALPTGDKAKELGEGKTEYKPFLAFLTQGKPVTIQGILGYEFGVGPTDTEQTLEGSGSLAYEVSETVHTFIEMIGRVGVTTPSVNIVVSPGIKYNFSKEFFIALAVPVGVTRTADDYRILTQLQWGF